MPLTPKQQRFVDEYLIDLNATQAAIRAGYSARSAAVEGARLLTNAKVGAAVAAAQSARATRTQITADAVLTRWWSIATADPNELIEQRRTCCRYCHGTDHRYQRTAEEWRRHEAYVAAQQCGDTAAASGIRDAEQAAEGPTWTLADPLGGPGFNATRPPAPDCPECHGEGVERTFVHDTRHLAPAARMLYAGVKVTKDGLQVLMQDQGAALVNVAKHLGMFTERVETRDLTLEALLDQIEPDGTADAG